MQAERARGYFGARRLAWLCVGIAIAATLTFLAGRWFWLPEMLCPFRPHLGAALAAAAVGWALAGQRAAAAGLGVLALIAAWPALWLHVPAQLAGAGQAPRGVTLRVATVNLLWGADTFDAVAAWLAEEQPDVVFLSEIDTTRRERLAELAQRYPHQRVSPAAGQWHVDTWGRAILSRLPFTAEREHWPERIVDVSVVHAGRSLRLLGAHPNRPGRSDQTRRRNATLALLARLAAEQDEVVVLGDLNVTEGSPHWSRLVTTARLTDTRAGRGRMGTWSVSVPRLGWRLPLRLPIDHVLLGASLATSDRRLGPGIGSDHLPVVADVGWR